LEAWPIEWHTLDTAELERSVAQKKKDGAKLHIVQLAEKRQKETKTAEVWEAAQKAAEQEKPIAVAAWAIAKKMGEGHTMPS